jgi:hypothetical protein
MLRNPHDVYLNVEAAWLASLHVPPSDVEHEVEDIGGSRRQRLARFLAQDMWVLWEAWGATAAVPRRVRRARSKPGRAIPRPGYCREDARLVQAVRNIRDYMNHRDRATDGTLLASKSGLFIYERGQAASLRPIYEGQFAIPYR